MKLWTSIKSLWQRISRNYYEATQYGSPGRPFVPGFVRDAKYDANQFARWEMVRKVRDMVRNSWLMWSIRETFVRYTIGSGQRVTPATSNPEYNRAACEAYESWCLSPQVDSILPMANAQVVIAGTYHVENEVFINLTSRTVNGQTVPAIQVIEGHRVGGLITNLEQNSSIIDGVEVDENQRPIAYHIRTGGDLDAKTERIRAFDPANPRAGGIIHLYEPDRAGMYRGITPYHAVINDHNDLKLLEDLEMDRSKANAAITYVLTTGTGEMPDTATQMRNRFNARGTPNNEVGKAFRDDIDARATQYQTITGGRAISLRTGEDMKQLAADTPSASTQWHWRYVVEKFCRASGIPIIFILPESVQGTVARGVYFDANRHLRRHAEAIRDRVTYQIYLFWLSWANGNLPALANKPADWRKAHITLPPLASVDPGREGVQMLSEYEAGTITLDDIAGTKGTTAEALIEGKARNVRMIHDIAERYGIKPGEICGPIADVLAKQQPEPEDDDNPPAKGKEPNESTN